jgi:peptide/nickel transport system substrate-binding protein
MSDERIHPLILEARERLRKGEITRRDFLRYATLLGASIAGANVLAACAQATAAPTAAPTAAQAVAAATLAPTAVPVVAATEAPTAVPTAIGGIIRGGILTLRARVDQAKDPAAFSLVSQSHPWRHVYDYLTSYDAKGIASPMLLESYTPSDDLKTWTLKVRPGIKFSNGQELTADDVVFNINRWLNKDTGSSLKGQLGYLSATGIEKKDAATVVLHLDTPTITLPYDLYAYPAMILPASFGGDITREAIGTGAFTVKEFTPAERAHLVARKDYWRIGADGKPLPYLDEIIMVHIGDDATTYLSALKGGQIEMIAEPPVTVWQGVKDDPAYTVIGIPTSATRVLRVRADQDPWKDEKVRLALKHCHNREKILALALQGQGVIGNDSHVAPAQPEFVQVDPVPYDVEKAKSLLKEAGVTAPVKVELTVASDWPESMAYAQALKEDAAGAFDITLKTMPATQYWNGWTDFNMGITWWSHRALAEMTLNVAYTADKDGKPVTWNESHWVDKEFSTLLEQANGTVDLEARKKIVGQIETIMRDRGSICTPFFMNVWEIYNKNVKGVTPSPEEFVILHEAWKDKAA